MSFQSVTTSAMAVVERASEPETTMVATREPSHGALREMGVSDAGEKPRSDHCCGGTVGDRPYQARISANAEDLVSYFSKRTQKYLDNIQGASWVYNVPGETPWSMKHDAKS